ncbi:sigma-70 family RNA polymerase sigma factor [Alishewanella sp. 16-MA]|uniref:Sigma-70 family RNA polymerase sigma factor n=1 Tax=Alishewanella maricola TaxID=2795740 RepID=A0ABS8C7S3_9ALTE|nr:sigma-70 family RNA polymerase sigma factor [Alishewanella maricola]MCB5228379.1 sigma-70 family RNA polymerase sigma factor [Alishewanella maricola]
MSNSLKTLEDMAAEVSLSASFRGKALALVKRNLSSFLHVDGQAENIAKDFVGEACKKFLIIAAKKGKAWDLHQRALETYGSSNCIITGYLYRSVYRATTNRQYHWGKDSETGEPRYKARQITPPINSDGSPSLDHNQWVQSLANNTLSDSQSTESLIEMLWEALEQGDLPVETVQMIKMRAEGMTFPEIAKEMNVSVDAVRMRINRAKRELGEILGELGGMQE